MITGIDHAPQNGVEIEKLEAGCLVRLYKNVKEETDAEGNVKMVADVVETVFPVEIAVENIVAHFDTYFNEAREKEVKEWKQKPEFLPKLLKEIADTDYHLFKFMDGKITAEEYEPWKTYRENMRIAIRAMEKAASVEELKQVVIPVKPA